ncbi:MAG TPA: LuxR C-terminal-related transcriptional regulator [Candidatus Limnocylindria bacterium]|nr:LuxR C-terminal-related transcriptional regulator [Candidatus Limnocylindria bacterium]
MPISGQELPAEPDLWAPVGFEHLPRELVSAFRGADWPQVRIRLQTVMDGMITDGPYGRELFQLVLQLPLGFDPVFERYRASAMVDHGDWDALRSSLAAQPLEPAEVRGIRDIITAPVDRASLPLMTEFHHRVLFETYEFQARRSMGPYRHWAQRIANYYPDLLWQRDDIPIGRHLRYRRLHDTICLAIGEAHAGRLEVAHALARESQRLGDEGEPMRIVARDLAELVRLGMGEKREFELALPAHVCRPTGPSPQGVWEFLLFLMPFLALREDGSLGWAARLAERIAVRLAAPRAELQAISWIVASELRAGRRGRDTELAGLVAQARRSPPGLKGLPVFLSGYAERSYEAFREAEHLARRAGNVWLQVSALVWMLAIEPQGSTARRLHRLLDITAWRQPVLAPPEVAADAALAMTVTGERGRSILELALTSDRPAVTTEVVMRHLDDPNVTNAARTAAVDVLGLVGTMQARDILARLAKRNDDVGRSAAKLSARAGTHLSLSEREVEVLSLAADGLTNRQIAERLYLSPHTVARHLANARAKLGASNRAEAAVRLEKSRES